MIVSAVTNLLVNLIGVWFFRNYARVNIGMYSLVSTMYTCLDLHETMHILLLYMIQPCLAALVYFVSLCFLKLYVPSIHIKRLHFLLSFFLIFILPCSLQKSRRYELPLRLLARHRRFHPQVLNLSTFLYLNQGHKNASF